MTVHDAYRQLSVTLQAIYEQREANHIASIVIEALTGFNNTERIVHRNVLFTRQQQTNFHLIVLDLLDHKPVQYALQEAHWYGMSLYVDEHVLIPRPETEELVSWCIGDIKQGTPGKVCKVLDIGTGSGIIAIALKKALPHTEVFAVDVSEEALQVAMHNAEEQQAEVAFSKVDILNEDSRSRLPLFDYIISNPPYITEQEAGAMDKNVLQFEPHLALFVPDNQPLLFYETIASFGVQHLYNGGVLFFEINESFGNEVARMLSDKGYANIEVKKDMQGKDRMVRAESQG